MNRQWWSKLRLNSARLGNVELRWSTPANAYLVSVPADHFIRHGQRGGVLVAFRTACLKVMKVICLELFTNLLNWLWFWYCYTTLREMECLIMYKGQKRPTKEVCLNLLSLFRSLYIRLSGKGKIVMSAAVCLCRANRFAKRLGCLQGIG